MGRAVTTVFYASKWCGRECMWFKCRFYITFLSNHLKTNKIPLSPLGSVKIYIMFYFFYHSATWPHLPHQPHIFSLVAPDAPVLPHFGGNVPGNHHVIVSVPIQRTLPVTVRHRHGCPGTDFRRHHRPQRPTPRQSVLRHGQNRPVDANRHRNPVHHRRHLVLIAICVWGLLTANPWPTTPGSALAARKIFLWRQQTLQRRHVPTLSGHDRWYSTPAASIPPQMMFRAILFSVTR